MSKKRQTFDIAIVGAGPLGLMAALTLAHQDYEVCLIGPKANEDGRTTAVMTNGIQLLQDIGVWDALEPKTAPLKTMRLVDGSKRLIRAPEAAFEASEIDQQAFGHNIKNNDLLSVLENAVDGQSNLTWEKRIVETLDLSGSSAKLEFVNSPSITATLLVGADGRNSIVRQNAGIETASWSYPQTALVMNLNHTRPHQFTSTEFHTETGPFTLVPLPGNHSSLVWVVKPDDANELADRPLDELSTLVSEKSHFLLGDISVLTKPMTYPLSGLTAQAFGDKNAVLVGESAHVFPPIGAQGMNLGVRDILSLVDVLAKHGSLRSEATTEITKQYDKARKLDIKLRTASVDLLNRSLLTDLLPVHLGRGVGLYALNKIPAMRKLIMQQGLGAR